MVARSTRAPSVQRRCGSRVSSEVYGVKLTVAGARLGTLELNGQACWRLREFLRDLTRNDRTSLLSS